MIIAEVVIWILYRDCLEIEEFHSKSECYSIITRFVTDTGYQRSPTFPMTNINAM